MQHTGKSRCCRHHRTCENCMVSRIGDRISGAGPRFLVAIIITVPDAEMGNDSGAGENGG